MGFNDTPSANRIYIGFFGKRNAGKSSLVNAVAGQELSIVSDIKGTTTDPVYKAMELLPAGPVMLVDTPGIDDEGSLGELRMKKTKQVLNKTDIAVLVVEGYAALSKEEEELVTLFQKREIPYLIAYNKMDLFCDRTEDFFDYSVETDAQGMKEAFQKGVFVSAWKKEGIHELKESMAHLIKAEEDRFRIVGDLLHPMDVALLVVPIDSSAPKGRLILPQQQVIRDILETGAVAVIVRDTELKGALRRLGEAPAMVITDSQVFKQVEKMIPKDVPLTSFSILMARRKGFLNAAVKGVTAFEDIRDGDNILIAEGCTHHRQCEDIGTVKIPNWIRSYTGKTPQFTFCSGMDFPENLSRYRLVIHCGACMLNDREMRYRMRQAEEQGVPFTNYGIAIAYLNGILSRCISMLFPE